MSRSATVWRVVAVVLVALGALAVARGLRGEAAVAEGQLLRPTGQLLAEVPPAPDTPTGPLPPAVAADLDTVFEDFTSFMDVSALGRLADGGDARVLWPLADLLRFYNDTRTEHAIAEREVGELTGLDLDGVDVPWRLVTDTLIAWDLPAPPGYADHKAALYTTFEPAWAALFDDADADVDHRLLTWGGVGIDARPLGDTEPCAVSCIPALDDPAVTDAAGGTWLDDDAIVFGVVVGDEARAYPRHVMETHELVNDTLGGVRIGIPYCTLCGAAQAFVTQDVDGVDGGLVLRTSGLLSRSNKVMYDLVTDSYFDTFRGVAVSGPLQGTQLEQLTVVTASWGAWQRAHPETTVVAQDAGIGREYDLDPLSGRDDDGAVFPIGAVDGRAGEQDEVLGVTLPDGRRLAVGVVGARSALARGERVVVEGVRVVEDGDGLRAQTEDGDELVSHQAFWFAWSQFHPDTLLWLAGPTTEVGSAETDEESP